jgi:hypothetical protein
MATDKLFAYIFWGEQRTVVYGLAGNSSSVVWMDGWMNSYADPLPAS